MRLMRGLQNVQESAVQGMTLELYGERMKAAVDQVLEGTRLTEVQRQDFLETAAANYMGRIDQQERKRGQFTSAYEASGLDPKSTLIDYIDQDLVKRFRSPVTEDEVSDAEVLAVLGL